MKNVYKPRIIALIICAVLMLSAMIGGGLAKYRTQKAIPGTAGPFTVQQAESFVAQESTVAVPENGDGSNEFGSDSSEGNTYLLIPGTKLNKNPSLTITKKTEIPSFLFAVVERTIIEGESVDFEMNSFWKAVDGLTTTSGGKETSVYVYVGTGTEAMIIDKTNAPTEDIELLKDNALYNKYLQKATDTQSFIVWGALVQATEEGITPKQAFEKAGTEILKDSTVKLQNEMTIVDVSCKIEEPGWTNGISTEKKDVTVKNTGDIPALIRAKVVVNWIDGNGDIVANPVGHSATISYGSNWTQLNGYYYYNGIVAKGGSTENLVTSAKAESGDQYTLQVEIIAEAIQATGFVDPTDANSETAVHNAWGHNFNGTTWN